MTRKIKCRCDGNSTIGMGHIVRCMSLASLLKDDFDISFYTYNCPPSTVQIIIEQHFQHINITDETVFLEQLQPDEIVVLDGYHFDTDYQIAIKSKGSKLVCIDDLASIHFVADMVINHTPGIEPSMYNNKIEPYTHLCLGTAYALLRKAFLEVNPNTTAPQKLHNGLICLGGADPQNKTLQIIKHALPSDISHIDVVIGPAYIHRNELDLFVLENEKYSIHTNISEYEMRDLMLKNDFAVVSASTISLESVFVGIPLYVDLSADNQIYLYNYLIENQAAFPIDGISSYTFEAGEKMLDVQQQISSKRKETNFSQIFTAVL